MQHMVHNSKAESFVPNTNSIPIGVAKHSNDNLHCTHPPSASTTALPPPTSTPLSSTRHMDLETYSEHII